VETPCGFPVSSKALAFFLSFKADAILCFFFFLSLLDLPGLCSLLSLRTMLYGGPAFSFPLFELAAIGFFSLGDCDAAPFPSDECHQFSSWPFKREAGTMILFARYAAEVSLP